MACPIELEKFFQTFIANLPHWAPDGVVRVNLSLLHHLGMINTNCWDTDPNNNHFNSNFQILDSEEKVTLFNHQFAIWITPQYTAESNDHKTLIFIAKIEENNPRLEIVYETTGVYNNPNYILKLLHPWLEEIEETERALATINQQKLDGQQLL